MKVETRTIVLVHGYTNNPPDFELWEIILREKQFRTETIPFFQKKTIYEPIQTYTKALPELIHTMDIGYSMGETIILFG